jgi:hypothetical protein
MKRRGFMLLAAATAIARNPVSAEVKIPRIGLIQPGSPQQNPGILDSFRRVSRRSVGLTAKTSLFSTAGPTSAPSGFPPSCRS